MCYNFVLVFFCIFAIFGLLEIKPKRTLCALICVGEGGETRGGRVSPLAGVMLEGTLGVVVIRKTIIYSSLRQLNTNPQQTHTQHGKEG